MMKRAPTVAAFLALFFVSQPLSVATAEPVLPSIEKATIAPEKSPRPKPAEWATATRQALSRTSATGAACEAHLLREWLRIRCPKGPLAAISLLGGERNDLLFWIVPPLDGAGVPGGGEAIFPLRKGEARVLQFWTFGEGYDGPLTVLPLFVVQEDWLDGAAGPTVTAL